MYNGDYECRLAKYEKYQHYRLVVIKDHKRQKKIQFDTLLLANKWNNKTMVLTMTVSS